MNTLYTTDRMILKISHPKFTTMVTDFLLRNQEIFEPFEAPKSAYYYTPKHQRAVLKSEAEAFKRRQFVRFYIFLKERPNSIIGTISFGNIKGAPFHSCSIGYKFDQSFHHQGYAYEATETAMLIAFYHMQMQRVEAYIKTDNYPSLHLIEKLGFESEGICRKLVQTNNHWAEHYIYARMNF